MRRAHLVPLALAFLAGVTSDVRNVALPVLVGACVCAVAVRPVPLNVRANVVAALALGVIDAHFRAHAAFANGDAHFERMAATIIDNAVSIDGTRAETSLRLADGSDALAFLPAGFPVGTRLIVRGKREAFDEARNPGEPSTRELQAERGATWRIVHARIIARAAPDPADATLWIPRARAWASLRVHAMLAEPGATILAGAMWGERGALPPDLRAEFQDTGTVHVLVTAGLHLGVVAALALGLLEALRCGRVGSALGAIAIVWLYAAFSGGHLPSLRAATMLSFALGARAAGRETFSWNALAAAALFVGALRPASVSSVSFGLSFSCVTAIFVFAKPIAAALERCGAPRVLREALGVALATQIGTWPLSAAAFLVIAPYAPLANAFVVPVVGVAMLDGFAMLALTPFPPLAMLCANIETSLVDWIVATVRFVGTLPGAHAVATPPPQWTIVTYDLALIGAAYALRRDRPRVAVAAVLLAGAFCLWPPRVESGDLRITAIDVGQADALLIRTPRGHAYLVDGGGRLERGADTSGNSTAEAVGTRVVVPFLVRAGIHHLDAVLLSHPHGDHAGGLAPVLRALGADGFADSGQPYAGHAYRDALEAAGELRVPMLEPRGGDVWQTDDGVTFRFYGPTLPYIAHTRNDINNNSLVFRLEYGAFRMLFTGDAGAETERRLLASGLDVRATVLKVGHHGSAYGSTPDFVRAVGASDAVISVGRDNLFGHPAASTLATLHAAGMTLHRTDRNGSVAVTTDGKHVAVADFIE